MPRVSKRARQLKKAREVRVQKLEAKKNDKKRKLERHALYEIIDQLPDDKIKPAQHLLDKLRYPEDPQKGQILSQK
jgi:hypothetical protein